MASAGMCQLTASRSILIPSFSSRCQPPLSCYLPDLKLNEVIFTFNNFLIKIIFNFLIIFSSLAERIHNANLSAPSDFTSLVNSLTHTCLQSYPPSPGHDRTHLLAKNRGKFTTKTESIIRMLPFEICWYFPRPGLGLSLKG